MAAGKLGFGVSAGDWPLEEQRTHHAIASLSGLRTAFLVPPQSMTSMAPSLRTRPGPQALFKVRNVYFTPTFMA